MNLNAEKSIKKTLSDKNLIPKNGHVVIGLSGGPDSMCLFHVLLNLREELGFSMSAVHLNHKFRPGYAEEDQEFVEEYCRKTGIYCYSKAVDVNEAASQRGETPEEAGRNERYRAFDEEALRIEKRGIPKGRIVIAVAQNRNDRVETVLMRILRGTGPDGLVGIPYSRMSEDGYRIIRPLLDTDREYIEDYCESENLMPRIDHTNSETDYSRNKIRLDLIPKLKSEFNYNLEDAIIRLSDLAARDKEYFDMAVENLLNEYCEFAYESGQVLASARIKTDILNESDQAVSRRIVIAILKKLGLTQGVEAAHIESAMKCIERNSTGKTVEFPSGYRMSISYGYAEFYSAGLTANPEDQVLDDLTVKIDDLIAINEKIENKKEYLLPEGKFVLRLAGDKDLAPSNGRFFLDIDAIMELGLDLRIRYRKPGDRISPKGMTGTKKLQDVFVDAKIPKDMRDSIPVLVLGDTILWAAGVRKSEKYAPKAHLKGGLLLEWMPNN